MAYQRSRPSPELVERFVVEPEPEGELDPAGLFAREGPVICDVGCARARYTVKLARAHPDLNVLGLEAKRDRVLDGVRRLDREGIENVRLLCGEAERLVGEWLAPASVLALFVICPDPWPKRRHAKRRFFQPGRPARCARVLVPQGGLFVKTDDPDYCRQIQGVVDACPLLERQEDWVAAGRRFDSSATSYYEERHAEEGRETTALAWARTDS